MMVNITCNKCDKCDKRDKRDKHDKHDSVLYFWNPDDSSITSMMVDTKCDKCDPLGPNRPTP